MSRRGRAWLAALIGLVATPALAVTNELTGFGKAAFGSSPDEVRKLYPKMEPLKPNEKLGAQTFTSEHLTRYVIRAAPVPEIKRTTEVELRFWKGKLWIYIVYFGEGNDEMVIKALTERLGPPNGDNPEKPGWQGKTSTAFVETAANWYSVGDNALGADAQSWFREALTGARQSAAAPAPAAGATTPGAAGTAAPPAATPAAPAATPAK